MSMAGATRRLPPLFITACFLLGVGMVCLAGTLVLQPPPHLFKGFMYISLAFVTFGTGEVLNHPKERLIAREQDTGNQPFYRRRNVCSLGNLCDICALLLLFMGLAALLYPR